MSQKLTDELKSHFLNMYLIAISDNDFDEKEMQAIMKIANDKGLTKEEFEQIILDPTKVRFEVPEDIITKIEYLFDFAKIIWADGKIEEEERHILIDFCRKFGFDDNIVEELAEWLLQIAQQNISRAQLHEEIEKLLNN